MVASLYRQLVLLFTGLLAGCISPRERFVSTHSHSSAVPTEYRLVFPDAVEIQVQGHSEFSGIFQLNPEGRIDLPGLDTPRIEGDTLAMLQTRLSNLMQIPPETIQCRVAQFRGQMLFVYGPIKGPPRAVSYEGPEDVVSFLRRVGGLDAGAALRRIHVVRSNLQRDLPPEVFEIDVHAIVQKNDPKSNLILMPLDEVYVGETSRSLLYKLLPEWLKIGRRVPREG